MIMGSVLKYLGSMDRLPVVPLVGYPVLRELGIPAADAFHDPKVHVRVIRKVVEELQMDLVLPLLDLTVEAEVLGAEVFYPQFDAPNIKKCPSLEEVGKVEREGRVPLMEAILKEAKEVADGLPVGFYITGPFTIAGQIIEITNLLKMVIKNPEAVDPILRLTTDTCIEYGRRLEEAGADFIVVAEPSASLISLDMYRKFVKPYLERLGKELRRDLVLHICGRASHLVREMAIPGIDGVSIDQNVPLSRAFEELPSDMLVFGNYPPTNLMFEDPETIEKKVSAMAEPFRDRRNYVVCTGCDIPSSTPIRNVKAFVETAKKIKRGS
mgnify:CR=1 FL=1